MTALLDFLPLLLFFLSFKWAEHHADQTALLLSQLGSSLGLHWQVPEAQAPAMLATIVVVIATLAQLLIMRALRRPLPPMLLASAFLVTVFGGLTLWLRNEAFIQWKPTLLYGLFALAFAGWRLVKGGRLIDRVLPADWRFEAPVLERLNWAWAGFFAAMGLLNAVTVLTLDFATWVSVKFWTVTVLPLLFVVAQTVYLARHMPKEGADATGPGVKEENAHG